jgi:hypothetical protein
MPSHDDGKRRLRPVVGMGDQGPRHGYRTIPAEIHNVVMTLTPEERADRATVNEAVRTQTSPLRSAGGADEFEVPMADEDALVAER